MEFCRRNQLQQTLLRSGEKHSVSFYVRVEPPIFESRQHPLGVVFVIRRAHMMRAGAEPPHTLADIRRHYAILKFLFPVALGERRFGGIAEKLSRGRSRRTGILLRRSLGT